MLKKRSPMLTAVLMIILCTSVLVGATYAQFTDNVVIGGSAVNSGDFKAEMSYWTGSSWANASGNPLFNHTRWEPGYTDVQRIKIENKGDFAFKYNLQIAPDAAPVGANLMDVIDVYFGALSVDETLQTGAPSGKFADFVAAKGLKKIGTLSQIQSNSDLVWGALLPNGGAEGASLPADVPVHAGEVQAYLVLHMQESAGNEYQGASLGSLKVTMTATQLVHDDAFANLNGGTTSPNVPTSVTVNVSAENGLLAEAVTLTNYATGVSATVPAGAKLADGATSLTLIVEEMTGSGANITLGENEVRVSYNVKILGLAADNTVPAIIYMGKALPEGLNIGNYEVYHVENGQTVQMTLAATAEPVSHNEFAYDPANGYVTLAMATFSEVALVADTENAWNGTVATAFAGGTGTEEDPYIIANADQLAYLGDRVSNDNENYGSKYYKLTADINIGGIENYNTDGRKVLFYPIGYNKVGGTTTDKGDWYTYGGSFKGVFDGAGHTISGIYQNTWAMVGDYSGTYYNDAMGLFGYVNGGTVKNLTIDNFYSEGEFAVTGCVTAYAAGNATFENIAITNSHPQTYNTGVAGIVG